MKNLINSNELGGWLVRFYLNYILINSCFDNKVYLSKTKTQKNNELNI